MAGCAEGPNPLDNYFRFVLFAFPYSRSNDKGAGYKRFYAALTCICDFDNKTQMKFEGSRFRLILYLLLFIAAMSITAVIPAQTRPTPTPRPRPFPCPPHCGDHTPPPHSTTSLRNLQQRQSVPDEFSLWTLQLLIASSSAG